MTKQFLSKYLVTLSQLHMYFLIIKYIKHSMGQKRLSMIFNKKLLYGLTDTLPQLLCGMALTGIVFFHEILKVTSSH